MIIKSFDTIVWQEGNSDMVKAYESTITLKVRHLLKKPISLSEVSVGSIEVLTIEQLEKDIKGIRKEGLCFVSSGGKIREPTIVEVAHDY